MMTKTLTAAQQELRLSGSDQNTSYVGVQLIGTFTATAVVEGSNDGGTTWVALEMVPWGGGSAVTSATAAGAWRCNTSGIGLVRVRCSAYTSGSINVYALPVVS